MYKNTDATHSKNWRVLNQRADGVHIEQVAALKTFLDQGCFINEVKKNIYTYTYLYYTSVWYIAKWEVSR